MVCSSTLDFSDCPHVSREALVALARSGQPYSAFFFGTEANDTKFALPIIKHLPAELKRLTFHGNIVSDKVLVAVSHRFTSLVILSIDNCDEYGVKGLEAIASGCPQLRHLYENSMDGLAQTLWRLYNPQLKIHVGTDDSDNGII